MAASSITRLWRRSGYGRSSGLTPVCRQPRWAGAGRTLHDLGLSAQRPLYRAWQADPAAVTRWKQVEYPKIAAQARAAGGTVYFADEAGVRSDYHAGTTWAQWP